MDNQIAIVVPVVILVALSGCMFTGPSTQELPMKPEKGTEKNVESFVMQYEETLRRNQIIEEHNPDSVDVHVTSANVTNSSQGFIIHLQVETSFRKGNNAGDGWYKAGYLVNDSVVIRDVKYPGSNDNLDPRNGTIVED